jgi:hypothetical protein
MSKNSNRLWYRKDEHANVSEILTENYASWLTLNLA